MSPTPATDRQLRYLKSLARQRGESFTYPTSAAQASAEIERLKGRRRGSYLERRVEERAVSEDFAGFAGANGVHEEEVEGYGSSARWR